MPRNGVDTNAFPTLGEQMTDTPMDSNENYMFFDQNGARVFNLEGDLINDVTAVADASEQGSPSFVTVRMMPEAEPGNAVPRNISGHLGTYATNTFFGGLAINPVPATTTIGTENQYNFGAQLFGNSQLPVPSTTVSLCGLPAIYAPAVPSMNVPPASTTGSFNQPSNQPFYNPVGYNSDFLPHGPLTSFAAEVYNSDNNNNTVFNPYKAVRTGAPSVEARSWGNLGGGFLNNHGFQPLPQLPLTPGSQVPATFLHGYTVSSTISHGDGTPGVGGGTPLTSNNPNTPAMPTTPYPASPADRGRGPHSGNNNAALLGIREEVSSGTEQGATPEGGGHGQDMEMHMPRADLATSDTQVDYLVRRNSQFVEPVSTRIQQMNNHVFTGNANGLYGSYGSDGSCDPRGNGGNNGPGGGWLHLAPQPRLPRYSFTASESVALGNRIAPLDTMLHAPAPQSAPVSAIGEPPASYQLPEDRSRQPHIQQHPASTLQSHQQHRRQQYQTQQQQQHQLQGQQLLQRQQQYQHQQQETLSLLSALPTIGIKRPRSETGDSAAGDDVNAVGVNDDDCAVESERESEVDAAPARSGPSRSRLKRIPACINCYLSRRGCDHNYPCKRCRRSKDGRPCIQNQQWKSMENIFRNILSDKLVATVDAVHGNKDLAHLRPDKALEKHTGRPIALKAALDVLSVMKFGKSLSFATFFEDTPVRHHTIFGPFYQACLVLQGRQVLQNSDKFVYTPQFEDDMRVLLALSTARALHFFDKNLEKNRLDREVPYGRRAHELVVFLAIMLEQTTQVTDLVAPVPPSGSESASETEARAQLAKQHRQLLYHLAYYLRKTSIMAFDRKASKKDMAADPAANKTTGKGKATGKSKATGKRKAAERGNIVDEESELKIDKHMHIGPDNKVYLEPTFWTSLSKRIQLDNRTDANAAADARIQDKGKAVARDDGSDDDVGDDLMRAHKVELPDSEEEQHVGTGTYLYGHASPWVGGAVEGNAGPSTFATLLGDGQSSSARAFTLPTKRIRQQPKMKDADEMEYDNDGLLEFRTRTDTILKEVLVRSFQEMHVQSDSQAGQVALTTDMDPDDGDREMEVQFMCGYRDSSGNWHINGSPHEDHLNSSGSGTNNDGNGNGGGNTQQNRGNSTYADDRGSSGAASSGRGGVLVAAEPVVHSSNMATTVAANTNNDTSFLAFFGDDHHRYPDDIEYHSDGSVGANEFDLFGSSIGGLDFSLFETPDALASGRGAGSGDTGGGPGTPAMSTPTLHGSSLRRRFSRAIQRTFRTPSV